MNLNFISINGTCNYLDYTEFENSVREGLKITCKEASIFLLNNFPVLLSTETAL